MWIVNVYRIIYVVVHAIYTVLEWLYAVTNYLFEKVHVAGQEVFLLNGRNSYALNHLNKTAQRPRHLTVILGLEEPDSKDVANIILWCIATQISFISFYDYKGNLKKREDDLQHEVSLYKHKDDHVIWHSDPKTVHKNGFVGRRIHVKIITNYDGKHSVVKLTKKIASSRNSDDVSVYKINQSLSEQFEFPDPDMGLVCGKVFRFFSYPPWQMRLTEFFRIDSIKDITFPVFLKLLLKFSTCEQRLGK